MLIEEGADATAAEGDGNYLLPMAVQTGNLELVQMLLDEGADVNEEMNVALNVGIFNVEFPGPGIHIAAAQGYNDILQLLLENGADPNQSVKPDGINEWQPITFAALRNQVETIALLVENGAEVDGMTEAGNPLTIADRPEAVQKLIELGADVNLRDDNGNIALNEARNAGNEEIVQILLDAGAVE